MRIPHRHTSWRLGSKGFGRVARTYVTEDTSVTRRAGIGSLPIHMVDSKDVGGGTRSPAELARLRLFGHDQMLHTHLSDATLARLVALQPGEEPDDEVDSNATTASFDGRDGELLDDQQADLTPTSDGADASFPQVSPVMPPATARGEMAKTALAELDTMDNTIWPEIETPEVEDDSTPDPALEKAMKSQLTRDLQIDARQEVVQDMSKQFHVLGHDKRVVFYAYQLASAGHLPAPRLILQNAGLAKEWFAEGLQLGLRTRTAGTLSVCDRVLAEWGGNPDKMERATGHIDQLIVTMPCWQTASALRKIRHRIDQNTVIVLIQDGLGMIEHLNQTVFNVPVRRPRYILGSSSCQLHNEQSKRFLVKLVLPGQLYLTATSHEIGIPMIVKPHPPVEQQAWAQNTLYNLVTLPHLSASARSQQQWWLQKIPNLVFKCAAEPIAVMLDCRYRTLLANHDARKLVHRAIEELHSIIVKLPKLNYPEFLEAISLEELKQQIMWEMKSRGRAQSDMLRLLRKGRDVDIGFLNGYFVRRAAELGIACPINKQLYSVVKARLRQRREEIKELIPFEESSNVRGTLAAKAAQALATAEKDSLKTGSVDRWDVLRQIGPAPSFEEALASAVPG